MFNKKGKPINEISSIAEDIFKLEEEKDETLEVFKVTRDKLKNVTEKLEKRKQQLTFMMEEIDKLNKDVDEKIKNNNITVNKLELIFNI